MASRSVHPKVIRNLRRLNSSAPSITAVPSLINPGRPEKVAKKPLQPTPTPSPPTTTADSASTSTSDFQLELDDTKRLFSSVSTPKLIKSASMLKISSYDRAADFGLWIMTSGLMNNPVVRKLVLAATEHTFYSHFCAGIDLEKAGRTVKKLWDSGLGAMLDYGLEHATDNESCDRNLQEFIRTINSTKSVDSCQVSFVVVKITAICPPSLLRRVSDLLRWEQKDKSLNLPWKLKTLPVFSQSSPLYHTMTRPPPLSREEEHDLELAFERLDKICKNSLEANKPLLIDAEDTAIQPAIDYFSYSAAIKYTGEEDDPLIFNTIQAYLKDAKERLVIAKKAADKMGVPVGFKLVRGAYMSSEKQFAASLGVKSPIHDDIQKTHNCFDDCAEFLLEEVARGSGSVVLATHNIESGRKAASKAISLGLERNNPYFQFAQLYGMAEVLSFSLRNEGFRVSKYLPFGPVEQIMPYLLRRAEENRGLLAASSIDRVLMKKELLRRLTSPDS
ncbi:Proline dehydrogenase 1, mitochondrial [Sesamum angolense]|uniref:Proline dehydrogenase n=1 Tax=Sesamum angolense TaxID=2727404 RepID=A0AAE1WHC3_9LAMI|nr:Proline dehydrogenase 1, mitochondrial [Sesamum angolense]